MSYAADVIAGKIPACQPVIQACERQLNDLRKFTNHSLFEWNENLAGRVCRFIELLPHIKGPKAGQLIQLEPWQCFILTTVFGWRRKDTGGRRFRRVYIEVPRGNAKSTLSSAVGLYCLSSDGEGGAEVYSAATTRDQAKIVFGDAKSMMRSNRPFANRIGVVANELAILHPKSNSKFEPLSREAKSLDGKNIHLAIVDELHAHKTREIYDVIETATAKRLSSLIWMITTAGSNTSGICYEQRVYTQKILQGVVDDDSQFGIIYTVDDKDVDNWTDPKIWIKANPNWGVSVMPEVIGQLATKAEQLPSAQSNFKTKHLNVWVNADQAWMDMRLWDRQADDSLREEDFAKETCFVGLDLATKTDIAAKAKVYVRMQPTPNGSGVEPHYYGFLDCYLPEQAVVDGRNASYRGWELEGRFKITPGDVVDFATIKQDLLEDDSTKHVAEYGFDPWQATQLAQELAEEGLTMVEVRATVANFSAPMKELDALVRQGRFHHDGNPILRWMVSNVVCHYDAKENVYPRKEVPENKIDGVVAMIIAMGRALLYQGSPLPYSATRGFLSL